MKTIEVNNKHVTGTVSEAQLEAMKPEAAAALKTLLEGSGAGNDFLGWLDLPTRTPDALLDDINATAAQLRKDCDYVVAIGIGGSYLGAKAVIEALSDAFSAYRSQSGTLCCLLARISARIIFMNLRIS